MTKTLNRFSTLTFDCYGTLIDWESGIWDALQPLIAASNRNDITREVGLMAFARAESARQKATPGLAYPELLSQVHNTIARDLGLDSSPAQDEGFGQSVAHWPAFADTADALRVLKQHFRLVILSNVNNQGFAYSNKKLGVEFDAVYTAEMIGTYKPHADNFAYMLNRLKNDFGVAQDHVLHTAQSLFHDHAQANNFGLSSAWIDRQYLNQSKSWGATAKMEIRPHYDFYFNSMAEMADAVQNAMA